MKPRTISKSATVFLLALWLIPCRADVELERHNLAKLVEEIDFLMRRVDQIKQEKSSDQRVYFHYGRLKEDLNKVRSGINDHITGSLNAGRQIKPVSGHYHDHR